MSCGSPPSTAPGKIRLCWPIVTRPMIVTLLISCVPRPMRALGPTTQNGPIRTSSSSSARGSTAAVGSTWVGITFQIPSSKFQVLNQHSGNLKPETWNLKLSGLTRSTHSLFNPSFFQQHLHQLGVQAVAALVRNDVPDQVAAGQGQVANQVERFVPHAF